MTWVFLAVIIIMIIYLEINWASKKMCQLRFMTEPEAIMAEKNEEITLTSSLANISRLPVSFATVTENLPDKAELMGSDYYVGEHFVNVGDKRFVRSHYALGSLKKITREEKFKVNKRGVYRYGEYSIYTGDFFGLKNLQVDGYVPKHVAILPSKVADKDMREVVGGFIGDISVRRFIMEDPILTVGFNEYTGREPLRDISWKRTAVQGKLMVNKYDYTSEPRAMILLNIEGGREADVERCFELVRMAIEMLEERKIPYGFRTNGMIFGPEGSISYVPAGVGRQHYKTMMYGLAGALNGCWYSFDTLVRTAIKNRGVNEHYLLVTVPTDDKATVILKNLSKQTGATLGVLVGKEENDV